MMAAQLAALVEQVWSDAMTWAPRLGFVIVLIVLGVATAWLVRMVVSITLRRLGVEALLQRLGVDRTLRRIGVRRSVPQVAGRITFYLVLFLFLRAGADILNLTAISEAIAAMLGYVPDIAAAVVIVMFGGVIAHLAGQAVRSAAAGSGIQFARAMGTAVSGFVLFVLGTMAISQLGIETRMAELAAVALLAGGALAFGLAAGLGGRESIRNVMAGFYARQTLTIGRELEIGGRSGVLVSISPTQLLLETETHIITVPTVVFLEEGGRQPKL